MEVYILMFEKNGETCMEVAYEKQMDKIIEYRERLGWKLTSKKNFWKWS